MNRYDTLIEFERPHTGPANAYGEPEQTWLPFRHAWAKVERGEPQTDADPVQTKRVAYVFRFGPDPDLDEHMRVRVDQRVVSIKDLVRDANEYIVYGEAVIHG